MYPNNRNRASQKFKAMDYVMPFLIILCVGVIVILAYNLYNAFTGADVKKSAYLHILSGNAKMKTWGTNDFFSITSDPVIMQGDEVQSSSDGKFIVEFFDGTLLRMDGNTSLVFTSIDSGSEPAITLQLLDGRVWINKVYRETGKTLITVNTKNLQIVSSKGNIFEVETIATDQAVRVFSGDGKDLDINVMDKEGKKAVETDTLGVGQEIVVTPAALEKYWAYQSPSVINAISDEFKKTDFYLWNEYEDKSPTKFEKSMDGDKFVKVEPEVVPTVVEEVVVTPEGDAETVDPKTPGTEAKVDEKTETPANATTQDPKLAVPKLAAPTLLSVGGITKPATDGSYTVSANPAILKGEVPAGTQKVTVNDFELKKFQPGAKSWTYYANADYGFMKEGENIYKVYALDDKGNKSDVLEFKVIYSKSTTPPPLVDTTPTQPAPTPTTPPATPPTP